MLFCISSPLIWAPSLGAHIWKPLNRPLQLPLKLKVFNVRCLVHFSWKSYKHFLRQTDCAHELCIYVCNANCAAKVQCLKNHWKYQIIPNWKKQNINGKKISRRCSNSGCRINPPPFYYLLKKKSNILNISFRLRTSYMNARAKKGKIFENFGKNVQNLKIFWKRVGDCIWLLHIINC